MSTTLETREDLSPAPTLRHSRADAQELRLRMLNDGWRMLETATDPTAVRPGEAGLTVTIAYFPEFRAYSLSASPAMVRTGTHAVDDAALVEVYTSRVSPHGSADWVPSRL